MLRPIRPNPLMATRIGMVCKLLILKMEIDQNRKITPAFIERGAKEHIDLGHDIG
jgi:hypothetical protein